MAGTWLAGRDALARLPRVLWRQPLAERLTTLLVSITLLSSLHFFCVAYTLYGEAETLGQFMSRT